MQNHDDPHQVHREDAANTDHGVGSSGNIE